MFQNFENFVKFCEDSKWSTFQNSASLNIYLLTLNSDQPFVSFVSRKAAEEEKEKTIHCMLLM